MYHSRQSVLIKKVQNRDEIDAERLFIGVSITHERKYQKG